MKFPGFEKKKKDNRPNKQRPNKDPEKDNFMHYGRETCFSRILFRHNAELIFFGKSTG